MTLTKMSMNHQSETKCKKLNLLLIKYTTEIRKTKNFAAF